LEEAKRNQQQIIQFTSGFDLKCVINVGSLLKPLAGTPSNKITTILGK
jgi:hypothetical protein